MAIKRGHAGIAEHLLLSGADPNAKDCGGDNPIHLAADRGQHETVIVLIQRGAKLDVLDSGEQTPLPVALLAGHVAIAQLFSM